MSKEYSETMELVGDWRIEAIEATHGRVTATCTAKDSTEWQRVADGAEPSIRTFDAVNHAAQALKKAGWND